MSRQRDSHRAWRGRLPRPAGLKLTCMTCGQERRSGRDHEHRECLKKLEEARHAERT